MECIVICEARDDCLIATGLADRVFLAENSWADGQLPDLRAWRGMEPEAETRDHSTGLAFTAWKAVKKLATREGVRVHGKYGQGHRRGAQVEARKALLLAERFDPARRCPLLLIRDTDLHRDRAAAFREATQADAGQRVVLLALPHPELEAWLLNGFKPRDEIEKGHWRTERKNLGFDPCREAYRLNPGAETTPDGEPIKTSTKRVLAVLVGHDDERKHQCWQDTPLDELRERGKLTGLTDFLAAVEQHLAPRLGSE